MLDKIFDFFLDGIIKFVFRLPSNPFLDMSSYFSALSGYIENLNYFVPFYAMRPIFNAWLVMVSSAIGVYITIRIVLRGV